MEDWRKDARHEPIIVDLETLVPKNHLLRKIEKVMDHEWLYERLSPYYCHNNCLKPVHVRGGLTVTVFITAFHIAIPPIPGVQYWGYLSVLGVYLLRFLEAVRTAITAKAADASRNRVQIIIVSSPVPGVTVGLVGSVGLLGFVAGI